jgi:GST-like protein
MAGAPLIQLYSWSTSNGRKIHIMLEEIGVPYEAHPVNIMKGEQFDPEFLSISPNNKIPVIIDTDGSDGEPITVFESGAILVYLGDKFDKLLPSDVRARTRVLQWLFFQVGGIGPLFGQRNHFSFAAAEKIPYAIERYENEAARLCKVVDGALADSEYIAGDYSIADIANFTWMKSYVDSGGNIDERFHLQRWLEQVGRRPAVKRGLAVLAEKSGNLDHSDETRDILFGKRQIKQSM